MKSKSHKKVWIPGQSLRKQSQIKEQPQVPASSIRISLKLPPAEVQTNQKSMFKMIVKTGLGNYFQSGLSFLPEGISAASKSGWGLSTFYTKPVWGISLKIG